VILDLVSLLVACCLRHGIVCESIARMFVISGGIRNDGVCRSVGLSAFVRELSDSYSTSSEFIEDTMII